MLAENATLSCRVNPRSATPKHTHTATARALAVPFLFWAVVRLVSVDTHRWLFGERRRHLLQTLKTKESSRRHTHLRQAWQAWTT